MHVCVNMLSGTRFKSKMGVHAEFNEVTKNDLLDKSYEQNIKIKDVNQLCVSVCLCSKAT